MARTGRPPLPFTLTGRLGPERQADALRRAHARAENYRVMNRKPPPDIAALEREYWRWRRRQQRAAAPP